MDLLADAVCKRNPIPLYNPIAVNSQSTKQQSDHLVRQGAIFVAPFQQSVYNRRQVANKKVFSLRLMAEKQRGFSDYTPVVGEPSAFSLSTLLQ